MHGRERKEQNAKDQAHIVVQMLVERYAFAVIFNIDFYFLDGFS